MKKSRSGKKLRCNAIEIADSRAAHPPEKPTPVPPYLQSTNEYVGIERKLSQHRCDNVHVLKEPVTAVQDVRRAGGENISQHVRP